MRRITLILTAAFIAAVGFSQTVYVVSDLGRNGYYRQKPIAELMGRMAEEDGPEAILALGDTHHFMGVESTADALWLTNYELIYSHPELQIPWLPILGNHEYRGNTRAVLDYSSVSRRWQMPARYYTTTLHEDGSTLRLVMLDTTPLIDKYRRNTDVYPDAAAQDWGRQLQWLDSVLNAATEQWIIVAGHHPVYADTGKDTTEREDMQKRVGAVLSKHKVDMYICGHIHNFQHIRPEKDGTDYIVNTSGSLSRPKVKPIAGTVFTSGEPGFSRLKATKETLSLEMINDRGEVIHTIERVRH